jgi:HAD superfamily hydrolase (TIGR01509 family)
MNSTLPTNPAPPAPDWVPSAIIFDFDGVIALSEPVHARAWHDVALRHGRALPAGFAESGIGKRDDTMAAELADHWRDAGSHHTVLECKRECYAARLHELPLVPGVEQALEAWSRRFRLAVATSSSRREVGHTLESRGLAGFIRVIIGVEDVTHFKPDPEPYLKAAALLGVAPAECLVFEDSPVGIMAAQRAGMVVAAMLTSFQPDQLPATPLRCADFIAARALLPCLQ